MSSMTIKLRHTTVRDLANYRSNRAAAQHSTTYAMWAHRKWITGLGEITDEGHQALRQWDALGEATSLPKSRRECIRALLLGHSYNDAAHKDCESHRLVNGTKVTERGHALLRLFFEHPEDE